MLVAHRGCRCHRPALPAGLKLGVITMSKSNVARKAATLAAATAEQVATEITTPEQRAAADPMNPQPAPALPTSAPAGWAPTAEKPLHYTSPVGNARPLQGYVVPAMVTADQSVLAHARAAAYKSFATGSGGALSVALHAWCAVQGLPAQAAVVIAYGLRNVPGLYYANAPYTAPGSWQQKFSAAPFAKGVAPAVCDEVTKAHAKVWEAYVLANPAAQAVHASIAGLPAIVPATEEAPAA